MKALILGIFVFLMGGVSFADHSNPPRPMAGTPVYRFYSGTDHLFTTDFYEGEEAGYRFEIEAFRLVRLQNIETRTLYRCINYNQFGGYHFVSRDPYCGGHEYDGVLGSVAVRARTGLVALHAFLNDTGHNDFIVTTNIVEGQIARYRYLGVYGYVLPGQ